MGRNEGAASITVIHLCTTRSYYQTSHSFQTNPLFNALCWVSSWGCYFWEILGKVVSSWLLSGNIFFQKLCGPFFLDEGLAIWQAVFTTVPKK